MDSWKYFLGGSPLRPERSRVLCVRPSKLARGTERRCGGRADVRTEKARRRMSNWRRMMAVFGEKGWMSPPESQRHSMIKRDGKYGVDT